MADYCPSCGEMRNANSTLCPFCGHLFPPPSSPAREEQSIPLVSTTGQQDLMRMPPPPVIVVQDQPVVMRRTRNANNAFYLEFLGLIGFLGIGQMYAGRVTLGIVMLLLWFGV